MKARKLVTGNKLTRFHAFLFVWNMISCMSGVVVQIICALSRVHWKTWRKKNSATVFVCVWVWKRKAAKHPHVSSWKNMPKQSKWKENENIMVQPLLSRVSFASMYLPLQLFSLTLLPQFSIADRLKADRHTRHTIHTVCRDMMTLALTG